MNYTFNYKFKDKSLFENALVHKSYCLNHEGVANNERLEFLGDSVLGMVIAEYIFKEYPELPEGELSKIRAAVVCEDSLYEIAKKTGLNDRIKLGKGEEMTGGRNRPSILSDAVEAVFAAIYLDGGLAEAKRVILSLLEESIEKAIKEKDFGDYKTALQELTQKEYDRAPEYKIIKEEGPDHNKKFLVSVTLFDKELATGSGKTKKAAEKEAAKAAVNKLTNKKV